jgi:hypothetical protein
MYKVIKTEKYVNGEEEYLFNSYNDFEEAYPDISVNKSYIDVRNLSVGSRVMVWYDDYITLAVYVFD